MPNVQYPTINKSTMNNETTLYHYDLANNVLAETDENGQVKMIYVYANGMRLAYIDEHGEVNLYHNDPLGSPIILTDEEGKITQRYIFDPFGTVILSKGINENRYTFTGKERDVESGLLYYGARYYNPETGRFITKDIAEPDYGNTQTLNRYVYCLNNPLVYVDPDGLDAILYMDKKGARGFGHMGLYFQNQEGKWFRADLSARDPDSWFAALKGSGNFEITKISGDQLNQAMNKYEGNYIYFRTTKNQDKMISEYNMMMEERFASGAEEYALLSNNCVYKTFQALEYASVFKMGHFSPIPRLAIMQAFNKLKNPAGQFANIINSASYNFSQWKNQFYFDLQWRWENFNL